MMGMRRLASPGLRTLVGFGTLLLLPDAAVCQDTVRRVSLPEALEAFAENSLALKIARSAAAEVAGAARQSRAYFNPSFSISRDDLDHDLEQHWEEVVLLSQPLEWPGRTAARRRAARHMMGAGAARLRGDSIRLAFDVREAYALAWFAEAAELTARQTASVIREVTEDAEIRLEAGDISAFEARRLRLERVQAEQDVAEAELQVRSARRYLAALIFPGTGIEEIGPAAGLEGVPPPVTREEALSALQERPDLVAAARELDAAQADLSAAKSGWVPSPTVGFGYRHQEDGFHGLSLGVDLPLPLFDRGGGAREEADARSSAAAYRLDLGRRLAENDLLTTSDRYASSRARLETAADGLLADGEALLSSAMAAYGENEMSLLELLDAASAFRNARLGALSMRSTAWIAYYDLLRAMGQPPEEEG